MFHFLQQRRQQHQQATLPQSANMEDTERPLVDFKTWFELEQASYGPLPFLIVDTVKKEANQGQSEEAGQSEEEPQKPKGRKAAEKGCRYRVICKCEGFEYVVSAEVICEDSKKTRCFKVIEKEDYRFIVKVFACKMAIFKVDFKIEASFYGGKTQQFTLSSYPAVAITKGPCRPGAVTSLLMRVYGKVGS